MIMLKWMKYIRITMHTYHYFLLSLSLFLFCSCSHPAEYTSYFKEYQLLRTVDSSLYVRISFMPVDGDQKVWKLELGEYEDSLLVAKDAFYGAAEWQGSQGGCYWWTFAEPHIQDVISYRDSPSTLNFPPGYNIFYPQLADLLENDELVLFPVFK